VHAPEFEEPKTVWLPISTAPSGLLFYTGSKFPDWQGHLFAGALAGQTLWHIPMEGGALGSAGKQSVSAVSALGQRIRDVKQGPDGWIYLLSTEGRVIRVER
jgi:glucose/arabinose dehydrogenase